MAAFTLAQIGFAALALVFFRIIYEVYRSYQVAKFARAHGCEEPFNISGQWPFSILDGWSRLWHTVDVVKAGGDIIDDAFAKQLEPANTTMLTNIDGTMGIDTIEPANIQAMLATQFKVSVSLSVDEEAMSDGRAGLWYGEDADQPVLRKCCLPQ